MSTLLIQSLCCERGERLLFSELSFALSSGEGVRVAGANGSGKTSLLRCLAGISDNYSGIIHWNDRDIRALRQAFTANLLYLGHQPAVKSTLTPIENLRWWSKLHGTPSDTRELLDALSQLRMEHVADTPCRYLSAGQQRRVALARLFIATQTLWILDEPYTALDVDGIARLEALFCEHLGREGMIIITTHQPISSGDFTTLDIDQLGREAQRVV